MNSINHVHVGVRDLPGTLDEFERVWQMPASFRGDAMAVVPAGPILLVLDTADSNTELTIGFASVDCDADSANAVSHGASLTEGPFDAPWGVRVAYLRGPAGITFEFEQPQPRQKATAK